MSASEVDAFLARLAAWARQQRDVHAVALVGSWARGSAGPESDVDVVMLTDAPRVYASGNGWLAELGAVTVHPPRRWGAITERRFAVAGGLTVDLGIGTSAWAATDPIDDGTRRVVEAGMRIVHDPDGALAALATACGHAA